uniref:Uncharacterized protein n=1 Tax=Pantoea phage Survivor TaxID=3232176 RepID=A0AAU8L093_9CAUD
MTPTESISQSQFGKIDITHSTDVINTDRLITEAKLMNLYIVERTDSVGYDEYDSCVVAAVSECAAKYEATELWSKYDPVTVKMIGVSGSQEPGVVHSSFNAG